MNRRKIKGRKTVKRNGRYYNNNKGSASKKLGAVLLALLTAGGSIWIAREELKKYELYTCDPDAVVQYIEDINMESDKTLITEPKVDFGKADITYIDADGEGRTIKLSKDIIDKIHLTKTGEIDKEILNEYGNIYRIDIGEQPRIDTTYTMNVHDEDDINSAVIDNAKNGEFVLGKQVDESGFVEIIYIDENGKKTYGYTSEDNLVLLGDISKGTEIIEAEKTENKNLVDTIEEDIIGGLTRNNDNLRYVSTGSDDELRLREEPSTDSSIIKTIANDTQVEIVPGEERKIGDHTWFKIKYVENNEVHYGYVAGEYLTEVEKQKVQIPEEKATLNIRTSPEIRDDNIITKVESGKSVNVIGEVIEIDGMTWARIKLDNGEIGYAASRYLIPDNKKENVADIEDVINKDKEQLVGVDSVGLSGTELEKYFNNPESDNITYNENVHADFVYIKLFAYGYGYHNDAGLSENAIEQAITCEKNGIPYGLYVYSTCINKEEAQEEFGTYNQYYAELEKALKEQGLEMRYNILPPAIDIEITENQKQERQLYAEEIADLPAEERIKQVTESKAYLADLLEKAYGYNPLLYFNARSSVGSEQIFDINVYNETRSKFSYIWFAGPENDDGVKAGRAAMPTGMILMGQEVLDRKDSNGVEVDYNKCPPEDLITLSKSNKISPLAAIMEYEEYMNQDIELV